MNKFTCVATDAALLRYWTWACFAQKLLVVSKLAVIVAGHLVAALCMLPDI